MCLKTVPITSQRLHHQQQPLLDPCLITNSVNISLIKDPNAILPIDCYCSNYVLVCINLKIYELSSSKKELTIPSMSYLFKDTRNSLARQKFSFFGYRYLVADSFIGVKFIEYTDPSQNFNDQQLSMDFIESSYFPRFSFNNFGNLAPLKFSQWPKLVISITVNENTPLILESGSFSNLLIDTLTFTYSVSDSTFPIYALTNSIINNLIIKKSPGFTSFSEPLDLDLALDTDNLGITVKNLIIDECLNFNLTKNSIPPFDGLISLEILSSGLTQIPDNYFLNQKHLALLSLRGNLIDTITANMFKGLEDKLIYLDLSNNPIKSINWQVFSSFTRLTNIELSRANMDKFVGDRRIEWPKSVHLNTINLNGYNFSSLHVCTNFFSSLNLENIFIKLDYTHECNCLVFYLYSRYRLNPQNSFSDWIMTNKTPVCYQNLFSQNGNFDEIIKLENQCDFRNMCPIKLEEHRIENLNKGVVIELGTFKPPIVLSTEKNLIQETEIITATSAQIEHLTEINAETTEITNEIIKELKYNVIELNTIDLVTSTFSEPTTQVLETTSEAVVVNDFIADFNTLPVLATMEVLTEEPINETILTTKFYEDKTVFFEVINNVTMAITVNSSEQINNTTILNMKKELAMKNLNTDSSSSSSLNSNAVIIISTLSFFAFFLLVAILFVVVYYRRKFVSYTPKPFEMYIKDERI